MGTMDEYNKMGPTLKYIRSVYGVNVSRTLVIHLIKEGELVGHQLQGERSNWYIQKASVDRYYSRLTEQS